MKVQSSLNNILQKAINAIAEGETKEALRLLRDNIHHFPESGKEIMMLSNRLENVLKISRHGTQQRETIVSESNSITSDTYDLIYEIQSKKDVAASLGEQVLISGADLLKHEYFPNTARLVPFGDLLEDLFFLGKPDHRFPIHGPNVIRFALALFDNEEVSVPGLFKTDLEGEDPHGEFTKYHQRIKDILTEKKEKEEAAKAQKKEDSIRNLLQVAALYHDIGKSIKLAKHPEIGANLLRNYKENERQRLISFLGSAGSDGGMETIQNRFDLLTSIVQHHDKFGVVSTGEGAPPIFSDILYFASNEGHILAVKKNVTAVMLLNLADIAAVNTASESRIKKAAEHAAAIKKVRGKITSRDRGDEMEENVEDDIEDEERLLSKLITICLEEQSSLGLNVRKIRNVMHDWSDLIDAIEITKGSKIALKEYLLEREKNPSRTIERILRLVEESMITAKARELAHEDYLSRTTVETTLVSILGTYQFLSFCEKYATVVKLDYGLRFFQSVVCACVREKIYPLNYENRHNEAFEEDEESKRPKAAARLTKDELAELSKLDTYDKNELTKKITSLITKVLAAIISRYSSIFDLNTQSPRRFGFEMTDLSENSQVWRSLIKQLCLDDDKEAFALSWMIDEVTIWSFD
jgi:hypothetical protein